VAQKMMESQEKGLDKEVLPLKGATEPTGGGGGSDDIAEVSWTVPTVVLRYPSQIPGMVGHHWSSGIAMATPIAHKGALAGAQAQAMTLVELLTDKELLAQAKAFYADQTKDVQWESLIPADIAPPVHFNKERMERYKPRLEELRYDASKYSSYLEQLGVEYPTLE
jgi:aminobenzoyl-glutamate utilization protein B